MNISRRDLIKMMGAAAPVAIFPNTLIGNAFASGIPMKDPDDGQQRKFNFNLDWLLFVGDPENAAEEHFDDTNWKKVTLPHAWNEDDAFKKDIRELSTGIAWYRKHFYLPESLQDEKIFIECEGLRQAGAFFINGQRVGLSEDGVMAFGFDITEFVHFGESPNVVAVRTDNSWDYRSQRTHSKFQWNDRNFYANYGGLNKNIYLHLTGKVYQTLPLFSDLGTTGVYIYGDQYDIPRKEVTVHVESQVKNEAAEKKEIELEVLIHDLDGTVVKRFTGDKSLVAPGEMKKLKASSGLKNVHFWSWGYGYLYNVQTILKVDGEIVDVVHTKTGFRKTAFRDGMIYLNDRVIQVHGYAQRTTNEWPAIGLSVPAWLSDYSNRLMVEGNANLVRWMHVTPWKQDVESCDRVGLMQAMPAGDSEGDVTGVRWEQRKTVMRDAIIYNRNNPSIIFYECGNKGISEAHMAEMKEIRDELDKFGGRAIGSREMLDSKIAEYGGEMLYIDKSSSKPLWAMEYSRDEGLRRYWDNYTFPFHKDGDGPAYKGQDASIYNRNMDSHAVENVKRWFDYWEARPGTGERVSAGGVNIVFSDTNTHHRGVVNYRTSGEVDAMRIKKQNYYANQVMWDGWVDVAENHLHIIGHWNYYTDAEKDIFVVSSAYKVELKLNGRSLGFGENSHRFLFTFKNIRWESGSLEAIGYDKNGERTCAERIETTSSSVALKLSLIDKPNTFKADGQDVALVEVEIVDEQGRCCPDAFELVHFDWDGPIAWRGGIAKGPDNFILSKDLPIEGGVGRILIRSTRIPGKITLRASSAGLKSASLKFESVSFSHSGGLSSDLPGNDLPSNLSRGLTPEGVSYQVSRIPLKIINATAGTNNKSTKNSYDDNERTAWENDGLLSTAWIEYELEKESLVSEVVMKLNRFRTNTYPLLISVDDQVVFEGDSKKSLGYFTAVCKPARGKRVKIQLHGLATREEAKYGEEVSGKKLGDEVGNSKENLKGSLSIIEIEVYGPPDKV